MADPRKTVIYFSCHYLPNMGGVEFFTRSLALGLEREGCRVIVATEEPSPEEAGHGGPEVVRMDRFGWERVPFLLWSRRTREILGWLAEQGADGILINTRFYGFSRVAARFAKRQGLQAVLIDHGTDYVRLSSRVLSWGVKVLEHVFTWQLRRLPVTFCGVSRGSSRWLRRFGISSVGEINNAIDAEAFVSQASGRDFVGELGVDPQALKVAFASRLVEDKGADTIISAAEAMGDARVHFFVAGSGPMQDRVARQAAALGNLSYLGRLDHPDLASLLLASDVFCYPTRYAEGMPTCLLEAGACSNALVTARTGGTEEIIPTKDHGVVLDDASAASVVSALRGLLGDRDRTACLKEAAHEHVLGHCTWERSAKQALSLMGLD